MDLDEAAHRQYIKMTATPVSKLICSLAAPTIVSMMTTSLYNMGDTFFVAKLGTSAAGAVGIVFSLMAVIQAVGFCFGMGAGSIISRKLGERADEEARTACSSAFFSAFGAGLLIAFLGLTNMDRLMYMLGTTDTILPYARSYASYILYGAPIMCSSFVMNTNLRAEGKAFFAMLGISTGGFLNLLLDPLFIFVFDMGIGGAAIATLISQCISFSIMLSHFIFHRSILRIDLRRMSHDFRLYLLIIKNGLPSLFRQGLGSFATIMLNFTAAAYGDAAVAAMSIVMRIIQFILSVMMGFGQGFQPVAGYNYGARRYDRLKAAFWFCVKVGTCLLTVLGALGFIFAPYVIAAFQRDDPQVLAIGTFALRCQCLTMPAQTLIVLSNMMFQSLGKAKQATFISSCRQGIYFLPAVIVLPHLMGLTGIQISQSVADVLTSLTTIPFLYFFLRSLNEQSDELKANTAAIKRTD